MDTTEAVKRVLAEEIARQRRRPGEVSRTAGVGKNTLYRILEGRVDLAVSTLWALSRALDVPMQEIAFRVDQRLSGRA